MIMTICLQVLKKLDEKITLLKNSTYNLGLFSEFGLRRRLSAGAQELAVKKLNENKYPGSTFVGTSNVFLAKIWHHSGRNDGA